MRRGSGTGGRKPPRLAWPSGPISLCRCIGRKYSQCHSGGSGVAGRDRRRRVVERRVERHRRASAPIVSCTRFAAADPRLQVVHRRLLFNASSSLGPVDAKGIPAPVCSGLHGKARPRPCASAHNEAATPPSGPLQTGPSVISPRPALRVANARHSRRYGCALRLDGGLR